MLFSILLPTLGLRIQEVNRLLESLSVQTFKDFEIVIVTQINHEGIGRLIEQWDMFNIQHIKIENKGLSLARNEGLKVCKGDWIILSDDDCWYPDNALEIIKNRIEEYSPDILLTEIYDPERKEYYKSYPAKAGKIKSKFQLMSKSSIELAIKSSIIRHNFDINLGLGAKYVCGEEVDFLLNHFKNSKIFFLPDVSVHHLKKDTKESDKQIKAKGVLYAKHYNFVIAIMICFRDLIKKKENNFRLFFEGYHEYNKGIRKVTNRR